MAILDVISPCTTWVPIFWGECIQLFARNKAALPDSHEDQDPNNAKPIESSSLDILPVVDGPLPHLPSDIISDILSRLPAKCIFRLQSESKVLYDLTTTAFFTQTHLSRANSPCIVVQSLDRSWNNNIKIFIFDEKAENRVEAVRLDLSPCDIHCGGNLMILFDSHDGFLLFKSDDICPSEVFCIVNPITKQQVTVTTSSSSHCYVCGFYFHPRKQEYELLYVCFTGGGQNEFYILSLGNNCRRSAGSCCYRPTNKRPAVIINGTLYWMVDRLRYLNEIHVFPSLSHSLIISFNIESEELRTMEAVVASNEATPARYGEPLQLFEMEGDLCLFDSSAKYEVIIWVFTCTTKCWVKAHSAATVPKSRRNVYWNFEHVLYYKKKGLLLGRRRWDNGLCVYDLLGDRPTYDYIYKKGFEGKTCSAVMHTPGLVYLHGDDSRISLGGPASYNPKGVAIHPQKPIKTKVTQ